MRGRKCEKETVKRTDREIKEKEETKGREEERRRGWRGKGRWREEELIQRVEKMMMEEINPDERCCKVWSGLAPQAEKPVGTLAGPSLVLLLFFFFRHSPLGF